MSTFTRQWAFVPLTACACATAHSEVASDQRADVLQHVQRFADAFRAADAETLAKLLAADYAHTNAGGAPLTREQWLAYIQKRRSDLQSGALTIAVYENRDLEVRVSNGAAVVTGTNHTEGVAAGRPFSTKLRFTQVWLRTGSGWVRWAFHDAPVASS